MNIQQEGIDTNIHMTIQVGYRRKYKYDNMQGMAQTQIQLLKFKVMIQIDKKNQCEDTDTNTHMKIQGKDKEIITNVKFPVRVQTHKKKMKIQGQE